MNLRETLEADLYGGERRPFFHLRLLKQLFFGRGGRGCIVTIRVMQHLHATGARRLSRRFQAALERIYGCYISPTAIIGPGLAMPHPVGVVIGEGVVIGANARIYQHTTFGGRIVGDMQRNAYPRIGDNVTAFAGAVMVGAITMGDRCIVGANAVVLDSFGDDCTLVGAPARATLTPAARRLAATQADRNAAGGA